MAASNARAPAVKSCANSSNRRFVHRPKCCAHDSATATISAMRRSECCACKTMPTVALRLRRCRE